MAEEREHCATCPYHYTETYRTEQLEKKQATQDTCLQDIKRSQAVIDKRLTIIEQKFDNIRYPIWIIFAAVLVQVAKAIVSFGPVVKAATGDG